ncbi:hypothetical protein Vafri_15237, partial [Volvox africanus]
QLQNRDSDRSSATGAAAVPQGPLMAAVLGSTADGGMSSGSLLTQTRVGQFMGNMAQDMVTSGVLGEAAGKVAQQVVSNQVNTMLQAMWANAAAGAAGGRRSLRAS